MVLKY